MALSTNRTLITQTGINTHQVLNVGGLDSAGIATFSNFKTGSTNVHSVGVEAAGINVLGGDTPIGAGATIYDDGGVRFVGVVTATSFVGDITGGGTFTGDISNATGAAAGLGTALSQTQTDPLNKVYYTNKVLSISTTTTIDHPATANLAYTQYGDIKIEDGHDLIIKDGDDFKYDILGISTTKIPNNQFPSGLSGDLTGNVTGDLTGNVTGSGANLTNIPAGQLTGALPAISGANLTGLTAGITMIDSWSITSNFTQGAGNTEVTANWRRNYAGSTYWGVLGSAMTESSGVFSFPATGIYLVQFNFHGRSNGSAQSYIGARLFVSQNAGVGYGQMAFNLSLIHI